uniref:Reverse transcriptase domain-containing protein n=1 Tax=Tanacetum cinerariifolium TaxID=118510 RepID=A0A699I958_TANCI|nr:hypothetical protein [Tanacetum cinerariifolium]
MTLNLPTVEPEDSLRMEDEHLDTILKTESDEFIKSSVENLVPNPSESEDDSECDVPACDDFTTFSNLLFDADDDFSSNPHHFNVESDLIESLLNHDSLIFFFFKIDSLLDEFVGELILYKSIPPRIDKVDCDPEEEIRLIKKLLYDNSSPCPPEELFLKILMLQSNLSLYLLSPLRISFHFDIPSSPRPPTKPPDDDEIKPNSGILTVKVAGDISEHYVPMPRLLPTQPTLVSNQEKSPHLLSHQGLKASQLSSESPMMIYGGNTPILDVPFIHFYPP